MATLANGLKTIELGSTTWRIICNDNFAKLSPMLYGLDSAKGTASDYDYQFYFATDTGIMYWSNGTAWTISNAPPQVHEHTTIDGDGTTFDITPGDGRTYRNVQVYDENGVKIEVTVVLTADNINIDLGSEDFNCVIVYNIY